MARGGSERKRVRRPATHSGPTLRGIKTGRPMKKASSGRSRDFRLRRGVGPKANRWFAEDGRRRRPNPLGCRAFLTDLPRRVSEERGPAWASRPALITLRRGARANRWFPGLFGRRRPGVWEIGPSSTGRLPVEMTNTNWQVHARHDSSLGRKGSENQANVLPKVENAPAMRSAMSQRPPFRDSSASLSRTRGLISRSLTGSFPPCRCNAFGILPVRAAIFGETRPGWSGCSMGLRFDRFPRRGTPAMTREGS